MNIAIVLISPADGIQKGRKDGRGTAPKKENPVTEFATGSRNGIKRRKERKPIHTGPAAKSPFLGKVILQPYCRTAFCSSY